MDIPSETIDKITRAIEEKGSSVDRTRIISKLNLLVQEFGIPLDEAERTVTNEFMRELGLNTPVRTADGDTKAIRDVEVNDWVTIEAKVVSLAPSPSEAIAQKGVLDDGTGAIEFVVWVKANAPILEERKWYRLESAVVDEFRGTQSLKVHSGTEIKLINEDRPIIPTITPIKDLQQGIASIRVKMVQNKETRHERMSQTGVVGDETGLIDFVTWKNDDGNEQLLPEKVYTLYYAKVDAFRDSLQIDLSAAMIIREDGADITVKDEYPCSATGTGSSQTSSSEDKKIQDVAVNDWVNIEAKVVSLSPAPSEAIAQKGVLDDGTGAIDFVVWQKANAPVLENKKWYRFESAVIDEFRTAPNMKIHSGTAIKPIDEDRPLNPAITAIQNLRPGIVSIRIKMVQDGGSRHERMFQTGVIGDETGAIKFVTWKNGEKTEEEQLRTDAVYIINYASVTQYQDKMQLDLSDATVADQEGAEIDVFMNEITLSGVLIHINGRSGLIKRCPVDGCNQILDRQNWCPIHENQEKQIYDFQISAALDDGEMVRNVLIPCDITEKITGITLDQAISIAENNPLGYDDVLMQIQSAIMGRYFTCTGIDVDDPVLVKKMEFHSIDMNRHAELLNKSAPSFAEENQEGEQYE